MKIIGHAWTLSTHQYWLKFSFVLWMLWILLSGLVQGLYTHYVVGYLLLAGIKLLPLLCMLPLIWQARHGRLLILVSVIVTLFMGNAMMAILQPSSHSLPPMAIGIELSIILAVLFFIMWVIERLPKLNPK